MGTVIIDIDADKREKNGVYKLTEEQESRLLTLKEYRTIAKKTIGSFAGGSLAREMLRSEDAISFVVEKLIDATCNWEESKGRTLRSWLNQCAIYAIKRWIDNIKRANKVDLRSLNKELNSDNARLKLSDITDSGSLSPYEEAFDNEEVSRQENRDLVSNILSSQAITDVQRECLSMAYLDGLRPVEISRTLGVSRQAVDQNLQRGLANLIQENAV
jgi:RNA polymerase sigma factor (sigma-70 family)